MSDVEEIKQLEDQRWVAQIGADLAALETLIGPELSYTHSNGLVDTKDSYIKAINKKVFDYQSESRTDTKVDLMGDTAMVTGRIEIKVVAGGRDINLDSRYSVIWVRRNGSWQFVCWQSTPIA